MKVIYLPEELKRYNYEGEDQIESYCDVINVLISTIEALCEELNIEVERTYIPEDMGKIIIK